MPAINEYAAAPPASAEAIERWLASAIEARLELAPGTVSAGARFSQYGVSSAVSLQIAAELGEWLGRRCSPALFWDHPTPRALASYLAGASDPVESAAPAAAPAHEAIAIVGMACRLPGAPDLNSFWDMLCSGTDAVGEVPAGRWDVSGTWDPDPARPGTSVSRHGGFLDDVAGFDPLAFGISPREAPYLDPQQRLALEVSWQALEDAGLALERLPRSRTGVFLGSIWNDYTRVPESTLEGLSSFSMTGHEMSVIAARISYTFGLQGPSLVVNTACSSSLVAVHLACASLLSGETDAALAGGVNLILAPDTYVSLTKMGGLSPDGRCKAFDAAADGFGRGEGAGIIVLKRLSDALHDGDRIHCIVRGSAINNDGASNGLTAPSSQAQQRMLRDALARAALAPADVQYIEAHGTGTALGDTIEAGALGAVFAPGRAQDAPLCVGSVKTNIGHAEGAAGIAGVIKTALALRHGVLPPSLHFRTPNPLIDFAALRLRVPVTAEPWPAGRRVAGVSSFGIGGTNAHVILEAWNRDAGCAAAVLAQSPAVEAQAPRPVVFVFAGQGSQWTGMAHAMLASEPTFRATVERIDTSLRRHVPWSLKKLLASSARLPADSDVLQPVLFAVQVALADVWRAYGISPAAVVGQSMGEVAAAYVAGCLTLDAAIDVICLRSALVARVKGRGGMMVAAVSSTEAEALAARHPGRLWVAVHAGPESCVLTGEEDALADVLADLQGRGVFARRVQVDYASHSPVVDDLEQAFAHALAGVPSMPPTVRFYSAAAGGFVASPRLDAGWWFETERRPARLDRAFEALLQDGYRVFLQVDPAPVLGPAIAQCARAATTDALVLPSVRRGEPRRGAFLESLARLHTLGHDIDPAPGSGGPQLLLLSAHSEHALATSAARLAEAVEQGIDLADLVYTAASRRTRRAHRRAVVFAARDALAARLRNAGADAGASWAGYAPQGEGEGPVFVFPGQGSQWPGMGRELLATEPVFAAAIDACADAMRPHIAWSLRDVLTGGGDASSLLERIDVVQPALFAMQTALAALWRAWGVVPAKVIGHSMGEVAAAVAAGHLSLADGAMIICRRSRLMRALSGRGAMLLVEMSRAEAEQLVAPRGLTVAVSNGPRAVVVAGEADAVEALEASLDDTDVFCRRVKVDVASHSPLVEPLRTPLLAALADVKPRDGDVPLYSTVRRRVVRGGELDAAYWVDNLREPVRFHEAIQSLSAEGASVFLEVSPHPVLLPAVADTLRDQGASAAALPTMRRDASAREGMLSVLAQLFVTGGWSDPAKLYPHGRCIPLPVYPFQREAFWLPAAPRKRVDTGRHPLLGPAVSVAAEPEVTLWSGDVAPEALPWLADHRVDESAVFPATGYLELLHAAAAEQWGDAPLRMRDVRFTRMLPLPEAGAVRLQLRWRAWSATRAEAKVFARAADDSWDEVCTAHVERIDAADDPHPDGANDAACRELSTEAVYRALAARGLPYGAAFQGVARMRFSTSRAESDLRAPRSVAREAHRYVLHPALLDAAFQALLFVGEHRADTPCVPTALAAWELLRRGAVPARAEARSRGETAELYVFDAEGRVVARARGITLQPLASERAGAEAELFHDIVWRPMPPAPPRAASGRWLVVSDDGGSGARLRARLEARGHRCVEVPAAAGHGATEEVRRAVAMLGGLDGVVHLGSLDAGIEMTDQGLRRSREAVTSLTQWLQAVLRAGFRDPPRCWAVTRLSQDTGDEAVVSAVQAPAWGLGRVAAYEHPELRPTLVDLSDPRVDEAALIGLLETDTPEREIALRAGAARVARLRRRSASEEPRGRVVPREGRAFKAHLRQPGILESFEMQPLEPRALAEHEVEISARTIGLNFRDVLAALGVQPGRRPGDVPAQECAGIVTAVGAGVRQLVVGDRVVAAAPGEIASVFAVASDLVRRIPDGLTFDDAASAAYAYVTASWGLEHLAHLERGERVLIHTASGATGLAAVRLAQIAGAEIFATAGTPEKRALLEAMGVPLVMSSRDCAFAKIVHARTGGAGVDVVFNTLAGEAHQRSLELLAPHGRFVDLSKRDIHDNRPLGLAALREGRVYAAVDVQAMITARPARFGEVLEDILRRLATAELSPIPRQVMPVSELEAGFRRMSQARHTGKICFSFEHAPAQLISRQPGAAIRGDGAYLVTGGAGGLGLALAKRLVEDGARSLVLMGRSAPSPQAEALISGLRAKGARVVFVQGDVSQREDVRRALEAAGPELRGVFHLAGVLMDSTLLNLRDDHFEAVFRAKVQGAWLLHELSRSRRPELFVLFSSAASVLGTAGQGNYAAANAFLDAFASWRRSQGLPCTSINWGAWTEVGLAAASSQRGDRLAGEGLSGFTAEEGLDALVQCIARGDERAAVMRFDVQAWRETFPRVAGAPFFAELERNREPRTSDWLDEVARLDRAERSQRLAAHVREQVARVLKLPEAHVHDRAPLKGLGMDSLMSLTLRNLLEASLRLRLPATLAWAHPTVDALTRFLATQLSWASEAPAEAPRPEEGELDGMSTDALAELLARELAAGSEAP